LSMKFYYFGESSSRSHWFTFLNYHDIMIILIIWTVIPK
jgi:hypothetical protein